MKIIYGDLVKLADVGMFDMIIHGANCFHTMGRRKIAVFSFSQIGYGVNNV